MAIPSLKYNCAYNNSADNLEPQISGFELKEVNFSEFDRRKAPRRFKQEVVYETASAHDGSFYE